MHAPEREQQKGGEHARIHMDVGSSQTAVFASERVPNADARHRELSKGDGEGDGDGDVNDV